MGDWFSFVHVFITKGALLDQLGHMMPVGHTSMHMMFTCGK